MGTEIKFLLTGMLLCATLTSQAQKTLPGIPQVKLEKSLKQGKPSATSQLELVKKKYPLLFKHKTEMLGPSSKLFKKARTKVSTKSLNVKKAPAFSGGATLPIWVNLISDDAPGYYSMTPGATITPEQLVAYSQGYFNAGCGIVDNKLTGIYLDATWIDFGIISVYNYSFDLDTWTLTGDRVSVKDYSLIALETAQDPQTDEIFGEFYNSDLSGYEWGVIDYETLTRTTIGTATHMMLALGITTDGKAYGIATDGNLYSIDRQTGTETLVGSTGLTLTDDDGAVYYQTGEVNPKTNVFYWASTDSEGNNKLYTVDLTSGQLTAVGDYSSDIGEFNTVGMVIPKPAAEDGAPDSIQNMTLNFTDANTTGEVTFTAPTKTFDETTDLTGTLNYEVAVNKGEPVTGTVAPGGTVTVQITATEGSCRFTARVGNDVGWGPTSYVTQYVGYDQPLAPTVTLDVNDDKVATVTWTAPTKTAHGGYLGDLTYNVCRMKPGDTTWVAENISGTTYTETMPEAELAYYTYGVVAKNATQQSPMGTSNGKVVGNALEVPYWEDFPTETDMNLYTVIDANNDGATWKWDSWDYAARYTLSVENTGDDWLFTPPIHMLAGKRYDVSFKARAFAYTYPERIEAKWGNDNTVEAMTNELAPSTDLTTGTFVEFKKTISPTEEGSYYLGFHAISDPNMCYLYVDSISINLAPDLTAPDSVTNLKATADQTGALKATLTFTAPEKTVEGNALDAIDSVLISKDNIVIGKLTSVSPGQECTFTDENATAGANNYTVTPYNEHGFGLKNDVSVFVGVDVPATPKVTLKDNLTSVTLTWPDVEGANGGVILPDDVTYTIYDVDDDGNLGSSLGTVTGDNEFEVDYNTLEGDEQNLKSWAVMATNSVGSSASAGIAYAITGRPYTLPFHNSFKNCTLEDQFVGIYSTSRYFSWGLAEFAYDDDRGALGFNGSAAGSGYIFTGKISLEGAVQPKILLYYKSLANVPAIFSIAVEHPDGTVDTPLFTTDFSTNTNTEWQRVMVDVPASCTSEPYIVLQLQGEATASMEDNLVLVDNVNLFDPQAFDAGVEVTATESVKKGQRADINVKVTNEGLEDVENPHLTLTVGDETVVDSTLNCTLTTLDNVKLNVAYRTSTLNTAESLNVRATLTEDDDDATNNEATAVIQTVDAGVAPPANLNAKGASPVDLTWEAPESTVRTMTDDFESYDAWSLTFGDWTTIDVDQGNAGSLTQGSTYTHQGEKFAFMNWQPSDLFATGQGLDPHSGTKALVAIYQIDDAGEHLVNSDNWLISPHLSGNAQTIHFWVNNQNGEGYGTETFQVLTSTTDNQQASFTQLGNDYTQSSGEWTEITVDVPEGTNYFAIHQISPAENTFLFMIDDVTMETSTGPVAYNIYRDGKLIATVTSINYTDNTTTTGGTYTYQVTAVYADGTESAPISTTIATTISELEKSGASSFDVYTLDGKQVLKDAKSLKGLKEGVYIINGVKTILRK
ncbi:MAG: choice-of-anchor J domain-containing protein [Prevotella sp.]|jgi:hypothetical protein